MSNKNNLKNDKYLEITRKLSEIAQAQRRLVLLKPFAPPKTIESVIRKLDTVNSLKNILPQDVLESPIVNLARQANLAISELSIFPKLESIFKGTTEISDIWKKQISPMSQSIASSLLGIQSQIAQISKISLLAEKSLIGINLNNIGALVSAPSQLLDLIIDKQILFSESYFSLFSSLCKQNFLSYSPVVTTLPPIEFFYNNRFLKAISVYRKDTNEEIALDTELTKETSDELETILCELDPSLIKLWRGATESLNSRNPDAVRHFAISLRELLTHVIHMLAPDNEVKNWSNLPEHFKNNRPTRRARLLYICREINYDPFSKFLRKDIDTILTSIDIIQEGAHAIDPPLTSLQLKALKNRIESTIRFLVKTWKESRND